MVSALHEILIDEIDDLRNSRATQSAERAVLLDEWLLEEDLSDKEIEWFETQLILMSVMNEKFQIEAWAQNAQLQKAFQRIQQKYPRRADAYRCRNWEKPMWLDFGCDKQEAP